MICIVCWPRLLRRFLRALSALVAVRRRGSRTLTLLNQQRNGSSLQQVAKRAVSVHLDLQRRQSGIFFQDITHASFQRSGSGLNQNHGRVLRRKFTYTSITLVFVSKSISQTLRSDVCARLTTRCFCCVTRYSSN